MDALAGCVLGGSRNQAVLCFSVGVFLQAYFSSYGSRTSALKKSDSMLSLCDPSHSNLKGYILGPS